MKTLQEFITTIVNEELSNATNESEKQSFDIHKIENLRSFKARVDYCNKSLTRLASGTSRVVYDLGNGSVLKLAKNPKGIAQNAAESDGFVQQSYGNIIAKVLDSHADDLWLKVEKAKKITPTRFKALSGGLTLVEIYHILTFWYADHNGKRSSIARHENYDEIMETNEFIQELTDLMGNMDMPVGDFARISTYGEINGRLVLTDYGLSQTVELDFYSR